ncbi:hypothetical protein F383_38664 [Gossypium arboreum]|uniref:Uncharacterized protein n=1 Tax=Gossypium arboreum TaxID=29729 RepID=A0A0B0MGQ1_GOSAR|nr:hypothetical protein F383_38664 [Gossypium arboreum]
MINSSQSLYLVLLINPINITQTWTDTRIQPTHRG